MALLILTNSNPSLLTVKNDNVSSILDALSEAVFLVDADRVIVLANKNAEEQFGEGLRGQDFVRVIRHPDCLRAIDDVLGGLDRAQASIVLPSLIPTVYQITVTELAVSSEDGPRAAIALRDLSNLHDAEQMRSDFVANVSHELRSPLTALNGFIETLKGTAKDDPKARQHFLGVMEREAQRMNRLIDDLLSLSRVEANKRVQPTGKLDVLKIIEQVTTTLDMQAAREGKKVEVRAPDVKFMIHGEADELTQVFQNLIENAIKYSAPESTVTIELSVADDVTGIAGHAVTVQIRDQGPGIDPIHIPRLTERFYRVDAGRSREHGGTGLGLAIVKHIVNRHRGKLQITSKVGVGSLFIVSLPAIDAAT